MAPGAQARFKADVQAAAQEDIPRISDVRRDDNEFVFTFHPEGLYTPFEICASLQDGSYLDCHRFLVFANGSIPDAAEAELEKFYAKSKGMTVSEVLHVLSCKLLASLENDDGDIVMSDGGSEDDDADIEMSDGGSEDEVDEDIVDFSVDDEAFGLSASLDRAGPNDVSGRKEMSRTKLDRIRSDFRAVRSSGFKYGRVLGDDYVAGNSITSISIRVGKLCLSEETIQAWNLDEEDFIVLLIKYNDAYATFDDVIEDPVGSWNLQFRLRKCSRHKPTLAEALAAFSPGPARKDASLGHTASPESADPFTSSLLFIGQSIDMFMDRDFIPMLKLKYRHKLSWDSARKWLSTVEKSSVPDFDQPPHPDEDAGLASDHNKLPSFLAEKSITGNTPASLPLIATQFALRYLVRCTDYCMVCHQPVQGNFEAMKPYVCGDSLCLFQYMSLGLGPSIDYEIVNQPYVVDLLVSFCYVSLQAADISRYGPIREYPTGLSLQVPNIRTYRSEHHGWNGRCFHMDGATLVDPIKVMVDWSRSVVEVKDPDRLGNIKSGQWVVIATSQSDNWPKDVLHHGQIETIALSNVTVRVVARHHDYGDLSQEELVQFNGPNQPRLPGYLVPYDQNLDDLGPLDKASAMRQLLAALPPVLEMRSYLTAQSHRQLAFWDRLSPASFGLLRWIVASNRSYIVQVDECPTNDGGTGDLKLVRPHERILGIDQWIQFRFAQGSPEKEARFQEALTRVAKPQKTILAWHGSPVVNWHSIIRQGLDFASYVHGRSFGNGVYFSRDFDISELYSSGPHGGSRNSSHRFMWRNSALNIEKAMSLNEIINAPEQFTSCSPHYVVQNTNWIQCRYLLIKPTATSPPESQGAKATEPIYNSSNLFRQDPGWEALGPKKKKIHIPRIAIPSAQSASKSKRKSNFLLKQDAHGHSGDSGDEDAADLEFLFPDGSDDETTPVDARNAPPTPDSTVAGSLLPRQTEPEPRTDFHPDALDLSTLPKLSPPAYANGEAQKMISREIKALQKTQTTTPLHELGWFAHFGDMTNMFHWIVELHSFEPDLPLAVDLKNAGMTSVVLEVRFGRNFPMSPPFVRVIRPRFRQFMLGGGGHVTTGGAMCMELLTNSGWTPAFGLESVFLQVRLALCSTEPRPARLENTRRPGQYSITEAVHAYKRLTEVHGWVVPPDLLESTTAMRPASADPDPSTPAAGVAGPSRPS